MKTISILTAGFAIALPAVASAHETAPIRREMTRQATLVEDGRRTGDLTHSEIATLQGEQDYISSMLQESLYDGSFTGREYYAITDAQAQAKRNIRSESNNDHVAYWRVRGGSDRDELGYPRELSRSGQGWGNGWGKRWGWGYGRRNWNTY